MNNAMNNTYQERLRVQGLTPQERIREIPGITILAGTATTTGWGRGAFTDEAGVHVTLERATPYDVPPDAGRIVSPAAYRATTITMVGGAYPALDHAARTAAFAVDAVQAVGTHSWIESLETN
jgi:hypothetical protein